MQTESNDFKLVFISSGDSSKDSDQLNSSLENAGAADTSLPSANGEFIGDMEYEDELTVTNGSNSGSNQNKVSQNVSLNVQFSIGEIATIFLKLFSKQSSSPKRGLRSDESFFTLMKKILRF